MEPKFGALSSSVDPSKLSTTVTGVIKTVAGILVFTGAISTVDANTVIEQIAVVVPAGYAIWNSCEILFGIGRKIVVFFFKKSA